MCISNSRVFGTLELPRPQKKSKFLKPFFFEFGAAKIFGRFVKKKIICVLSQVIFSLAKNFHFFQKWTIKSENKSHCKISGSNNGFVPLSTFRFPLHAFRLLFSPPLGPKIFWAQKKNFKFFSNFFESSNFYLKVDWFSNLSNFDFSSSPNQTPKSPTLSSPNVRNKIYFFVTK